MLNLRYRGQLLAIDGTAWQIDILQEAYSGAVGELTFEADEPLVIEWKETPKEEVICSSEATIRIESPGDRTYEDLYTIAPGQIRLDVSRKARGASSWQLYWSGMLDPEFYEEPYERARNYPVTLTFSDFGMLDRLKFGGLVGKTTVWMLLSVALTSSRLNYTMDYVPGSIPGSTAIPTFSSLRFAGTDSTAPLDEICVVADNFYDEDGDPCTMKEAIEGVLQPLGLKLIQRAGKIWVFDLNGLYTNATPRQIDWSGDSQTMGADRVYNNVKITWSPYVKSGNLGEDECFVKGTDRNVTALDINDPDLNAHNPAYGKLAGRDLTCTIYSYHHSNDPADWQDETDCGFTLWTCAEGKNATLAPAPDMLHEGPQFFKIVSQEDGDDSQGIAIRWPGVYLPEQASSAFVVMHGPGWTKGGYASSVGDMLWKSRDIELPPVAQTGLRLCITLEMLMDCRVNPFEEAVNIYGSNSNTLACKEWSDRWKARGNFVYIPVRITFRPEGSQTTYTWTNIDVISASIGNFPRKSLESTLGQWSSSATHGYLCWYNPTDRAEQTGVLGWQPNRPAINPHTDSLSTTLKSLGTGQWIPLPEGASSGGTLTIEVMSAGWIIADGNVSLDAASSPDTNDLWLSKTLWCLMKLPKVEVRKAQAYDNELDTDDVEYKAVVNADAREDLELQTICGTAEGGVAMARGAYWRGLTQIERMTRAGRTAPVEQLLIGTIYSQYATRHTTLQGEATLDPGTLTTYSEQNQGAKRFIMLSERQDVRMATAECLFCELSPDQYDRQT